MIEQRLIGSHTEIYTNGGGNSFITEAFPTNFHTFTTRKVLAPGDSIDRYKEVTAAERTKLEAADAAWVRPSDELIAEWNVKFGIWGKYNAATGYFEGNGLLDITTEQARAILTAGPLFGDATSIYSSNGPFTKIRTNQPAQRVSTRDIPYTLYKHAISNEAMFEVINLNPADREAPLYVQGNINDYTLFRTNYLGVFDFEKVTSFYTLRANKSYYTGVPQIFIKNLKIAWSEYFSMNYESVRFLVDNAANTTPLNLKMTPGNYAALTGTAESYPVNGGTQEEWTQLLEDAAEKQITFTT